MATINLSVIVPNPKTILQFFSVIKVYRSTVGLAGPYIEISGVGTRPVLNVNTTLYTYTDTAGDDSFYYKTSFFNPLSSLESSLSDAQQGEGDPALNVLSVEQLKTNYLFGFDLSDESGVPFPDSFFEYWIRVAVSYIEDVMDIPLRPLVITNELHDYVRQDYYRFMWLQLLKVPVISIQQVRMVLPNDQLVITMDNSWLQPDLVSGQLQIIPGPSNAGQLALLTHGFWGFATDVIPNVFQVDYTAGFLEGQVPFDLVDLVGMIAAIGPLSTLGDVIFGPGISGTNIALDALMTRLMTTKGAQGGGAFAGRINQYNQMIKQRMHELRRVYKGVRFVVA